MKKLLAGLTLAAAALPSTALLADTGDQSQHRHGAATVENQSGEHAGHGRMQRMHERMTRRERGHGGQDYRGNHDMHRGDTGYDCPMHGDQKMG